MLRISCATPTSGEHPQLVGDTLQMLQLPSGPILSRVVTDQILCLYWPCWFLCFHGCVHLSLRLFIMQDHLSVKSSWYLHLNVPIQDHTTNRGMCRTEEDCHALATLHLGTHHLSPIFHHGVEWFYLFHVCLLHHPLLCEFSPFLFSA